MNNLTSSQYYSNQSTSWTSLKDELIQIKIQSELSSAWTSPFFKESSHLGKIQIIPFSSTKEATLEPLSINSVESVSLDMSTYVILIESNNKKQIEKNKKAISLIMKWLSNSTPNAQKNDTASLKEVMKEIDKNRLSDRKHFP